MTEIIDLEDGRLLLAAKRGFRNWASKFGEAFDHTTRLSDVSSETLSFLSQGREKGTFYIYDLIMNLKNMGSGFEFYELSPEEKIEVIDEYLFLLDMIRFECMKRLGWLESYPGEDISLAELIIRFEKLAPHLQAKVPILDKRHPSFEKFKDMDTIDKESFVRKMIPKAIGEFQVYSSTL